MALPSGFRVSFFFTFAGVRNMGWTENFWNSGQFGAAGMVQKVKDILSLRQYCTSNQAWISAFRISDVTTSRNVYNEGTLYGPTNGAGIDGDAAQVKLLIALRASGNYLTRQWIGGMRDEDITKGGKYTPTTSFPTVFAAFAAALQTGGWSIYNQDRTVLARPITGITNAGVVSFGANPYAEGDSIRIKNVHGYTEANRIWRVTLPTSTTVTLVGWVPYTHAPIFSGTNAVAVLQKGVLSAITSVEIVRGSKHDVGRPTGQGIGRRRRRPSAADLALVGP